MHHFMVLRDSYGFKRILIIFATSFCRINHLATDMPGFCLVLLSLRLLQINSVVSVLILLRLKILVFASTWLIGLTCGLGPFSFERNSFNFAADCWH